MNEEAQEVGLKRKLSSSNDHEIVLPLETSSPESTKRKRQYAAEYETDLEEHFGGDNRDGQILDATLQGQSLPFSHDTVEVHCSSNQHHQEICAKTKKVYER